MGEISINRAMQDIKPLGNRLFIEPEKEEKTTKSGIVIPETADKERPMRGKVVAVGPGKRDEKGNRTPMSVEVGNVVLFRKYGPDEIEVNGKTYLVGDEDDVLAVINVDSTSSPQEGGSVHSTEASAGGGQAGQGGGEGNRPVESEASNPSQQLSQGPRPDMLGGGNTNTNNQNF